MDIFDVLLNAGVITCALVSYLIFFKRSPVRQGDYREPGWNYSLKYLFARFYAVKLWKGKLKGRSVDVSELPRDGQYEGWDGIRIRTASTEGAAVLIGIRKLCRHQPLAEVTLHVKFPDGANYKLPRHPDTVVGAWVNITDGWSAGGLKIQVMEAGNRMRIFYNGLLTSDDGVTRHAQINFIWASASDVTRYPEDWSDQLAATALALEPWRDGNWANLLEKWKESSWSQWGSVQGRVQLFDSDSVVRTEYLHTRGLRERRYTPMPHAIRRVVALTAVARDGTAVEYRAQSYKNVITQCTWGTVRFPNTSVRSITGSSLHLPEFCELPDSIPSVFTLDVSTQGRNLRLVVRPSTEGGKLLNGVPYQLETYFRAAAVEIDGEPGYGILELGYVPSVIMEPSVPLYPAAALRWVTKSEADASFCLQFESRAAACPELVGGKGASLALLASVQKAEGYKVPPGFCITVTALETHLQTNPQLLQAIRDIEAANENYYEANFKEKCAKAVELFNTTEITGKLLDEILQNLNEVRKKATKEDLGPERRFAVRSSAVGEDSETLSAAGQNETILGCVSDSDVIKGVQKCWASMFAFTSAYYRRQNGQACLCGGGVVVQALASARVAGVMFTRHPRAGDPTRLLLTANYGLGESVVSGSVEPDTTEVSRSQDGRLTIASTQLGSKIHRVNVGEAGVTTEEVPEGERGVACLTEAEALGLAHIGVAQELLWGAPRDIEWAVGPKNEIYLLQARPITSLERWTEEELLHELDTPIMADDEFTTFANCGEVFPKPVTPMSYDMVLWPLIKNMNKVIAPDMGNYEDSIAVTHNRCMIALYNSVYRRAPPEVDVNIRMVEMAVHGHKVADDEVIRAAVRRRPPQWMDKINLMTFLVKSILYSKWCMNDTVKKVKEFSISTETEDPHSLLSSIHQSTEVMGRASLNHAFTSAASTCSQFVAMAVLLEGASDFTPEHCNEICAMLSSGDVLSAEVPLGLAKLNEKIEESGKAEEFRKQDPKDAMRWLQKKLPHIHLDVCVFLDQHGHRAIMEFDMYTKPWALVPEELMKVLQNLRLTRQEAPAARSDADVISSLTLPKKPSTRKVLAWVLPLCRRTVRHRESTKAHLILAVHKLRLAAIELGKLLVRQWYLPDHELVFFFRIAELKKYIETRDPALLRKAIQRRQNFPSWCKLKFSELNTGWVRPLEASSAKLRAGERVHATSVCGGEVVARACVVKDLAEINQLQQGDILITYATDIGWSPYFPLLAGIVTELGGLISHGAVIAREYGLPCIVGATHATEVFKTGDIVRLIGATGVIEKVEVIEPKDDSGDFVVIDGDTEQNAN